MTKWDWNAKTITYGRNNNLQQNHPAFSDRSIKNKPNRQQIRCAPCSKKPNSNKTLLHNRDQQQCTKKHRYKGLRKSDTKIMNNTQTNNPVFRRKKRRTKAKRTQAETSNTQQTEAHPSWRHNIRQRYQIRMESRNNSLWPVKTKMTWRLQDTNTHQCAARYQEHARENKRSKQVAKQ